MPRGAYFVKMRKINDSKKKKLLMLLSPCPLASWLDFKKHQPLKFLQSLSSSKASSAHENGRNLYATALAFLFIAGASLSLSLLAFFIHSLFLLTEPNSCEEEATI